MGICKFCGQDTKLVKSHIIPKFVYRPVLDASKEYALQISNDPDAYVKKSRIGIYDKTILCGDCEAQFAEYDDYAAKFFNQDNITHDIISIDNEEVIHIEGYSYEKLKLFFLFTLWKSSVSTHDLFQAVNLGPIHEPLIKEMLNNKNPGSDDEYTISAFKFDSDITLKILHCPAASRLGAKALRYYDFYMLGFHFIIKVDQREPEEHMHPFSLKENGEIFIPFVNFYNSREFGRLQEMVKIHLL